MLDSLVIEIYAGDTSFDGRNKMCRNHVYISKIGLWIFQYVRNMLNSRLAHDLEHNMFMLHLSSWHFLSLFYTSIMHKTL